MTECQRTDCEDQHYATVVMSSHCWKAMEYGLCRRFAMNPFDVLRAKWKMKEEKVIK